MAENSKVIQLKLHQYRKPGLYLVFDDGRRLDLTHENTDRVTEIYWDDPEKMPPHVKAAVNFKRCDFCPLKNREDFCDALRPVLPLLDVIDTFSSFDKVTAIYKGDTGDLCHVSYTSMQKALESVSSLSLMSYCRVGRKYLKYFNGVIPILKTEDIVDRLFLNVYWIHRGDEEAVNRVIADMNREITITTENQLKRLRLICNKDAFLNAYILSHLVTDLLHENRDRRMKEMVRRVDPTSSTMD